MINTRLGSAELDWLAEVLEAPCQLGEFALEGLIRKSSTAMVFVARGGVFGEADGVIKLTGSEYAPLLARELELLRWCQSVGVGGVVRPKAATLVWLEIDGVPRIEAANAPSARTRVACLLLPFLSGGDLVGWIGDHATRTGQLGACPALEAGMQVGGTLRALLAQSPPLVHHDVKPQNALFPRPGAAVGELTLIDFDVAEHLPVALKADVAPPPEVALSLLQDVHGFGELLYSLASGCEPPAEGSVDPGTDNPHFNALVVRCLQAELATDEYSSLADERLWRDLDRSAAFERRLIAGRLRRVLRSYVSSRGALAGTGVVLLIALAGAIAARVAGG